MDNSDLRLSGSKHRPDEQKGVLFLTVVLAIAQISVMIELGESSRWRVVLEDFPKISVSAPLRDTACRGGWERRSNSLPPPWLERWRGGPNVWLGSEAVFRRESSTSRARRNRECRGSEDDEANGYGAGTRCYAASCVLIRYRGTGCDLSTRQETRSHAARTLQNVPAK